MNLADIDPFVERLSQGCCDPDCGDCPGKSGNGYGAGQLATLLASAVSWANFDDLVEMVAGVIEIQTTAAKEAYWQAVYDALTEE